VYTLYRANTVRRGRELGIRDRVKQLGVFVDYAADNTSPPYRRVDRDDHAGVVVRRMLVQTLMWTVSDEMVLVLTQHRTGVMIRNLHPNAKPALASEAWVLVGLGERGVAGGRFDGRGQPRRTAWGLGAAQSHASRMIPHGGRRTSNVYGEYSSG
jgi:hypothetical protein